MKKERPTEYTGLPVGIGVAIMRLSKDGKTRECVAQVDHEHHDVVLEAIKKFDGFVLDK
jgi:hypothetical protein